MKLLNNPADIAGLRVTVQGLGLHGGGLATARYLASHGASVTATDLRDETILKPSIQALEGLDIRFVLGRHEEEDFSKADVVVKNPAVRRNNPFLTLAKQIETDISLFLRWYQGPVLAITGSKGKSSTASALHHGLGTIIPQTRLGGNITVSPLTFLDDLLDLGDFNAPSNHRVGYREKNRRQIPVVLELSSFQLGDLALAGVQLDTVYSAVTNIHRDHQDYYDGMEAYVADKRLIFQDQTNTRRQLFFTDQDWGRGFLVQALDSGGEDIWSVGREPVKNQRIAGQLYLETVSGGGSRGILQKTGNEAQVVFTEDRLVTGHHQGINLLFAAAGMQLFGAEPQQIREALNSYPGIEHRMEFCGIIRGVRCYNDSAATIPESVLAAVQSMETPIHLVTGGTDKNLDFSLYSQIGAFPASISILDGTGAGGILTALRKGGHQFSGPHPDLRAAVLAALEKARPGEVVIFSPGCASFGMFLNEFDRGRRFKSLIQSLMQ